MLTFENPSTKCWFNAALQAIIHVPPIANLFRDRDLFQRILFTKRKNCSDFASELSNLIEEYWSTPEHTGTKDVSTMVDLFSKVNRNFAGRKMYDATECFMKIIEMLDSAFIPHETPFLPETANKDAWIEYIQKEKKSFLSDVLLGQAVQTFNGSSHFTHFEGIVISCNNRSVEDGIQEFLHDSNTGVSRVVTKFPLILPVFLQKSQDKPFVAYDTKLKFSEVTYDLFTVLLHVGNHWVALGKGPAGWNCFDDSKMVRITNMNDIVQKEAMLLMYKIS